MINVSKEVTKIVLNEMSKYSGEYPTDRN